MNEIEICNLRSQKCFYAFDVRVDRASILGNPFFMKSESERDEVCDKYEAYFNRKFETDDAFRKEILRLVSIYKKYKRLRLFCWCYPKRCHSMYIKSKLEDIIKNEGEN